MSETDYYQRSRCRTCGCPWGEDFNLPHEEGCWDSEARVKERELASKPTREALAAWKKSG